MGKHSEHGLHRKVFHWIGQDDPFGEKHAHVPTHKLISAEEVVTKHGIPRAELQKYIESEIEETEAFSSLPFTLFFVAAYAIMVIIHDEAVVVRAVEDSIDFDIVDNANWAFDSPWVGHKDIHDVHSVADFWSWCSKGLIPLLFVQEKSAAEGRNMSDPAIMKLVEPFPVDDRGILLNYNRMVGGVRFRQERATAHRCKTPGKLIKFFNRSCAGLSYETDPESWDARGMRNPKRTEWFYVRTDLAQHERKILRMEAEQWLDRYTNKVEIGIPVYTAEFGLHTLITVNFYFSRGGHIWKRIIPHSTYASWHTYWYYIIYDFVWLLCLIHVFRTETKEVRSIIRQYGWRKLWSKYVSFWNTVDWLSVLGGFTIVLLWALTIGLRERCNFYTAELGRLDPEFDWKKYTDAVSMYMTALEDVVSYVYIFKLVLAAYPLMIVLRLFKAFANQPRLALVTNTLIITGVDLLHFMLVFISVFVTLAISGLVLFGRRLDTFNTFPRAVNTVFRLMLGDFDWDAIRSVGQVEGAAWLIITLSIMNLLLLNMVLAIVLDGYSEVKRSTGSADTLFTEISQIWTRWWGARRGTLVTLQAINGALIELDREFFRRSQKDALERDLGGDDKDRAVLIGRDSKAEEGMRVEPNDPDLAEFTGAGEIVQVGVGHLQCRVRHFKLGNVREYNIGHDLEYELKLCDPTKAVDLDLEDQQLQGLRGLSPERLMKVLATAGYRMPMSQAMKILKDAVMHYYNEHCEDVDIDDVRQMIRKVRFRSKKIKDVIQAGGAGQSLSLHACEELRLLREYLHEFYMSVDDDRQETWCKIRDVQSEVDDLRSRLRSVAPDQYKKIAEKADKRSNQQLQPKASALDSVFESRENAQIIEGNGNRSAPEEANETSTHEVLQGLEPQVEEAPQNAMADQGVGEPHQQGGSSARKNAAAIDTPLSRNVPFTPVMPTYTQPAPPTILENTTYESNRHERKDQQRPEPRQRKKRQSSLSSDDGSVISSRSQDSSQMNVENMEELDDDALLAQLDVMLDRSARARGLRKRPPVPRHVPSSRAGSVSSFDLESTVDPTEAKVDAIVIGI